MADLSNLQGWLRVNDYRRSVRCFLNLKVFRECSYCFRGVSPELMLLMLSLIFSRSGIGEQVPARLDGTLVPLC